MIDRNHPRYLAVYGAAVATMALRNHPDEDVSDAAMAIQVEMAHHVAAHAEESQPDADDVALQAQRDRALGAAVRAWSCEYCHYPCTFGDAGYVTTCSHCAASLKTLVAKLIAAELPPPSACVPSIEGARGLDLNDEEVPR